MVTDNAASPPRAHRRSLRSLDDLDPTLSLMYFALRGMTREADETLALHDLSRAHHRILFVIARRDGITVGDLHVHLGVTAQAVHRPLKKLAESGMVAVSRDPTRHRFKALHLTEKGREIEHEASEAERRVMRRVLERLGPDAWGSWSSVMEAIGENA